jgi:hypothetical protein
MVAGPVSAVVRALEVALVTEVESALETVSELDRD